MMKSLRWFLIVVAVIVAVFSTSITGFFYFHRSMYRGAGQAWLRDTLQNEKELSRAVYELSRIDAMPDDLRTSDPKSYAVSLDALEQSIAAGPVVLDFQRESYFGLHYLVCTANDEKYEFIVAESSLFNRSLKSLRLYLRIIGKPGIPEDLLGLTIIGNDARVGYGGIP